MWWPLARRRLRLRTGTWRGDGRGSFSFTVPREALGSAVSVELVGHTAVQFVGAATAGVPTAVRAGEGPAPLVPVAVMLMLAVLTLLGTAMSRQVTEQH
jgi:hypothetical protein